MVYYHCRHCKSEIGKLPLSLAAETLSSVRKIDESIVNHPFIVRGIDGCLTILTVCEQCEQTLAENPYYYALEKWLQ